MDEPGQPRAARWPAALARIARERLLGRFDRRRRIFRWQPGAVTLASAPLEPRRIDRLADVPRSIMRESDPAGLPLTWYQHFFTHGAVLWTAIENGRALGSAWVIGSDGIGEWYVPLEPDARVLYGVVTPAWARGRGVAAALALAAARDAGGAAVYLDCMIWNRGAQRAFGKAGFVPVGVAGTRLREARLGPDA